MVHCTINKKKVEKRTFQTMPKSPYTLAKEVLALNHLMYDPIVHSMNAMVLFGENEGDTAAVLNNLIGFSYGKLHHQSLKHPLSFLSVDEDTNTRPQKALRKAYEQKIAEEGLIETRNQNVHDTFGGACWLSFPKTKSAMNFLHQQEMQQAETNTIIQHRGALRDFLTLFDECGVVLLIDEQLDLPIEEDFRAHAWQKLFIAQRHYFDTSISTMIIGHALFEKGLAPYLALTGHVLFLRVSATIIGALKAERGNGKAYATALSTVDTALADRVLAKKDWRTRDLSPLPLFGIPHWHPMNHQSQFYENQQIFRPPRKPKA